MRVPHLTYQQGSAAGTALCGGMHWAEVYCATLQAVGLKTSPTRSTVQSVTFNSAIAVYVSEVVLHYLVEIHLPTVSEFHRMHDMWYAQKLV